MFGLLVQLRGDFRLVVGYGQTARDRDLTLPWGGCGGGDSEKKYVPIPVRFITEEDFAGKGAEVKLAVAFGFSVAYEPYEIRGSWGISC